MKKIVLILAVILLMGCATMRYGDDLKEPYSQKEIELSGAVAIGFSVASVFLGQYIIEQNR